MRTSFRLILWIILSTLILLLPGFLLLYFSLENKENQLLQTTIEKESEEINAKIEKKLSEWSIRVDDLSQNVINMWNHQKIERDFLNLYLQDYILKKPGFFGVWTVWESNAFDKKDFYYRNDSLYTVHGQYTAYFYLHKDKIERDILDSFYSESFGTYYLKPKRMKQAVWILPTTYVIKGEKFELTSYVKPVIFQNEFLGAIGADFKPDSIIEILKSEISNYITDIYITNEEGKLAYKESKYKSDNTAKENINPDSLNIEFSKAYSLDSFKNQSFSSDFPFATFHINLNQNIQWKAYLRIDIKELKKVVGSESSLFFWTFLVCFFIYAVLIVWILHSFHRPIWSSVDVAFRIADGDLDFVIDQKLLKRRDILGQLYKAIDLMHISLKEKAQIDSSENLKREWIQNGLNKLFETMRGDQRISELSRNIIRFICQYLECQPGALYVYYQKTKYFRLLGKYALDLPNKSKSFVKLGEGLLGQAAVENKVRIIEGIEDSYFSTSSTLHKITPNTILIFPLTYNDKIIGVVELGKISAFEEKHIEFMYNIAENLAIGVNTAIIREKYYRYKYNEK